MSAKQDYAIPDDRQYTDSDEWVLIEDDVARIGVTDYAQSELSDIVFVELPEIASEVGSGDAFGVVESVKAVSDLYAPLAGEVVQVNEDLADHPEWVNEDPYGRGWMVAIRLGDDPDTRALLSAEEYRERVEERAGS